MSTVVVSQRVGVDAETGEVRDALDQRWTKFLAAAGFTAVPVPNGCDVTAFATAMRDVRGIVWSGGGDLAATSASPTNALRDATEVGLLNAFPQVPVIGVCRGAQHLCARDGWQLSPIAGHVRAAHGLAAFGANALRAHAGLQVNSFHMLAPVGAGATLRAVLRADDGSIEGLERDDCRAVAVLWHPERADPFLAEDLALFSRVFR